MSQRDIAIIGMACVFPGAPDLQTYWRNIVNRVDAITDIRPDRMDVRFYDPESNDTDRFYTKRGGFIDDEAMKFDPAAFGIMPMAARGAEPDQLLTLKVAKAALDDAGYGNREFPRERTSIILGRGSYLTPGQLQLATRVRATEELLDALRTLLPNLGEAELHRIKTEYQAQCGVFGPDSAIGLVPNLVASRIANRLDLGGSAYVIDAACASSLVAIDSLCKELAGGSTDLGLAGGVHFGHDATFWSVFSQIGALSHRQQIRPFHANADGLLIGEGVGVIVLKRQADALRDGDRIYATIRGTGVASDGRDASLMSPRVEGQLLALKRAWDAAGLDPASVGLVEAHGTGTPAGDGAELTTLTRFFGHAAEHERRAGLGSVKSMIGHTMPAAGAAAMIKAALSVYHGILPPTLHCEDPNPAIDESRFRIMQEAEPWTDGVRRAGVNAFGFGGINAHVILDNESDPSGAVMRPPVPAMTQGAESGHDSAKRSPSEIKLQFAVPLIHLDEPPLKTTAMPSMSVDANSEVLRKFQSSVDEIMQAHLMVTQAYGSERKQPPSAAPAPVASTPSLAEHKETLHISLDNYPELIDHGLYPQPEGWPVAADRAPTVPMTMSLKLMRTAAEKLMPGKIAVALEKVVAASWLRAEPPTDVEISVRQLDEARVAVKLGTFVEGTVVLADSYPQQRAIDPRPLRNEAAPPIGLDEVYRDGWLFHGPGYQAITDVDSMADDGARGSIVALPAEGSLLDAAGQLFGLWIAVRHEMDRVAMPVRIGRIEFFEGDPPTGTVCDCVVRVQSVGQRQVRADIEVIRDGQIYAAITNWESWRFQMGANTYSIIRQPHYNLAAEVHPQGFVSFRETGFGEAGFELFRGRFVTLDEIAESKTFKLPARGAQWLYGRIAAKDAVRRILFQHRSQPVFPSEIKIASDEKGKPLASGPYDEDIRVSIAHTDGIAVALAAEGADPGIDIEKIEPRSEGFATLTLAAEELSILPARSDEWLTRAWCAKEAAGKATGEGLNNAPKSLRIRRIDGQRLLVEGLWVDTTLVDEFVVAWTVRRPQSSFVSKMKSLRPLQRRLTAR